MCMFSGPVTSVDQTKMFARSAGAGRQFLVYAMSFAADADVAMILPVPVPASPPEDAIRFIDLHRYPGFFEDLESAFLRLESGPRGLGSIEEESSSTLTVHEVGAFEASFVPRLADFDRLDARFRLPQQVWDQLPGYADFGFAVFKLRSGVSGSVQKKRVHPMAFEFPVRDPSRLFFPTVHVHDGAVHATAWFDHVLHYQGDFSAQLVAPQPARASVDVTRAAGIVDPDAPFRMRILRGPDSNRDTFIGPGHVARAHRWV